MASAVVRSVAFECLVAVCGQRGAMRNAERHFSDFATLDPCHGGWKANMPSTTQTKGKGNINREAIGGTSLDKTFKFRHTWQNLQKI